jgi:phosphatidylglycerophosphate synthase
MMADKAEGDRRPLKSRKLPVWKALVPVLAQRGVSPNSVSCAGLFIGLSAGILFAATAFVEPGPAQRAIWLVAGVAALSRGAFNVLDGVLAVETGASSPVGLLWNEVPDRFSDVALMVGAGYAAGSLPVLGWAAAVAAVLVAYTRAQCNAAGAPMDFGGIMAKPIRIVTISVAALWMALTPSAWQPTWGTDPAVGFMGIVLAVVCGGSVATIAGRLLRASRALREGAA